MADINFSRIDADGDVTVYASQHIGRDPDFKLTELADAPEIPAGSGPSVLLDARYELVDFTGRDEDRHELANWLTGDAPRLARLVTGPGGQGKTRLALRVARDAKAAGQRVLVARHRRDGGLPGPAIRKQIIRRRHGVLVIVDYADRWPYPDLLSLFDHPELPADRPGRRVRVLMLARSPQLLTMLHIDLPRRGIAISHMPLGDIEDTSSGMLEREKLFRAAVEGFARHFQMPKSRFPEEPPLGGAGFKLMLSVQMAALVSMLAVREGLPDSRRRELAVDPAAASRHLIAREVRNWNMTMHGVAVPAQIAPDTMARAVLVATLTRGLGDDDARSLLDSLNLGGNARLILDHHKRCYPPIDCEALQPLLPDRLGEDFLAAVLRPPASARLESDSLAGLADGGASGIVRKLLSRHDSARLVPGSGPAVEWPHPHVGPVVIELIEVSLRWDHVAAEHLLPQISDNPFLALVAGSDAIGRLCQVRDAKTVLPDVGAALDRVIGAGVNLGLDAGAVLVAKLLTDTERVRRDPLGRAHALRTLSRRRMAVGDRQGALDSAQEAVDLFERETDQGAGRGADLSGLSSALTNLAIVQSELGWLQAALSSTRKAISLYRQVTGEHSHAHVEDRRGLGAALNNLAKLLSEDGKPADALGPAQEAVRIYQQLVGSDAASLLDLASSLTNLAKTQSELSEPAEALNSAQEAVRLIRAAADPVVGNPDAAMPALALALANLGSYQSDVGHHREALSAVQEAVDVYRIVADPETGNQAAYRPELATSLGVLSSALATLGRHDDALDRAEEAVGLYRQLADSDGGDPAGHLPGLASSLAKLAALLWEAGHRADALEPAQEALSIRWKLADPATPELAAAMLGLAGSLQQVIVFLSGLGSSDKALGSAKDLAYVYGRLAADPGADDPDAYQASYAASLQDVRDRLSALDMHDEALRYARDATECCRKLAARPGGDTAARKADLAAALHRMGMLLSETSEKGLPQEALDSLRQAVLIRRSLADQITEHQTVYLSSLANSLDDLAILLWEADHGAKALEPAEEAVKIRWKLANPADPVPVAALRGIAGSLHNMIIFWSALDERGKALDPARQLAYVYGRLAADPGADDPDAYQASYAASLQDVRDRLSALGMHDEALRYARDAAECCRKLAARPGGDTAARKADLAAALHSLAAALVEHGQQVGNGQDDAPLEAIRDAVRIRRDLVAQETGNRTAYKAALAISLTAEALILRQRDGEGATAVGKEAVNIWTGLEDRLPGKHTQRLTYSLAVLGRILHETGRREEAAEVARRLAEYDTE